MLVGAAIGDTPDILDRVQALVKANVDVVAFDSAHGHSTRVGDAIRKVKHAFPDLQLIAGNIATGEAAKDLIDAGADALKVGMGPVVRSVRTQCGCRYRRTADYRQSVRYIR